MTKNNNIIVQPVLAAPPIQNKMEIIDQLRGAEWIEEVFSVCQNIDGLDDRSLRMIKGKVVEISIASALAASHVDKIGVDIEWCGRNVEIKFEKKIGSRCTRALKNPMASSKICETYPYYIQFQILLFVTPYSVHCIFSDDILPAMLVRTSDQVKISIDYDNAVLHEVASITVEEAKELKSITSNVSPFEEEIDKVICKVRNQISSCVRHGRTTSKVRQNFSDTVRRGSDRKQ